MLPVKVSISSVLREYKLAVDANQAMAKIRFCAVQGARYIVRSCAAVSGDTPSPCAIYASKLP